MGPGQQRWCLELCRAGHVARENSSQSHGCKSFWSSQGNESAPAVGEKSTWEGRQRIQSSWLVSKFDHLY